MKTNINHSIIRRYSLFAILFLVFSTSKISAQTETDSLEDIVTFAEQMPEFKGGEEAMHKYLSETLIVPKDSKGNFITGKVILVFVVTKSGKIVRIQNLSKNADPLLVEEAIRGIEKMPDWRSGKQNGKPVNVNYVLPIVFK